MTAERSYTVDAADSIAAQAIRDGQRIRTVKRVVLVDPPVEARDARYRVTLAVESES